MARTVLGQARAANAVVVMGGEDVDPRLYGGRTDYPGAGRHELAADVTTTAVIQQAVARRTPLLGICRGHQLLDVALGGTLVEHMDGHRRADGDHFVRTRLELDGLDGVPAEVLCTHHQAVRTLGRGLRVMARATDGTVEAVAHDSAPALGVQWHPEHPDVAGEQVPALLARVAGAPC